MTDLSESTALAALMERAAAGNSDAAAELLTAHRARLHALIGLRLDRRLLGRVDASDVVQEAMIEANRRLPAYLKAPPMGFYLWLRQLAIQKLIDLHRRHIGAGKRAATQEVSLQQGQGPDASSASLAQQLLGNLTTPTEAARRGELQDNVQSALDKLEPVDREVLTLRHFEQLTNEETAQVLGLSRAGASKRYIVALTRLREHLATLPEFAEWISGEPSQAK